MNDARELFTALYGETLPSGSNLLIWTLPTRTSYWCPSIDDTLKTVEKVRKNARGVYFGIGLAPAIDPRTDKPYEIDARCESEHVVAIPGIWGDFDILDNNGVAHKKKNLPPSREAILDLLRLAGHEPTISVNSGHGLQAYWKFDELLVIDSPEKNEYAAMLVRRWNNTLRIIAKTRGWDVDATHDLARVFRVPDTMNRKIDGDHRPVTIVNHEPSRVYKPSEIESWFIDTDTNAPAGKRSKDYTDVVVADDLVLDPNASVSIDMIEALKESDEKFSASWERKRKDFSDQSGSSYDMSLATIAANLGLPDQVIVNLLINHRRMHKDNLKLRIDYYRNTLFKAKQGIAKEEAFEAIEHIVEGGEVDEATIKSLADEAPDGEILTEDDIKRGAILKHCSQMLEIKLKRIMKYAASESTYVLETDCGRITLGDISGLVKQDRFRLRVFDLVGVGIPRFKPAQWDKIAQSLRDAVETIDVGEEATEEGALKSWLRLYIQDNPPSTCISAEVALNQSPYMAEDEAVCIFLTGFQDWLNRRLGQRDTGKNLGTLMRMFGAVSFSQPVEIRGKKTTRNAWRLPCTAEQLQ